MRHMLTALALAGAFAALAAAPSAFAQGALGSSDGAPGWPMHLPRQRTAGAGGVVAAAAAALLAAAASRRR